MNINTGDIVMYRGKHYICKQCGDYFKLYSDPTMIDLKFVTKKHCLRLVTRKDFITEKDIEDMDKNRQIDYLWDIIENLSERIDKLEK